MRAFSNLSALMRRKYLFFAQHFLTKHRKNKRSPVFTCLHISLSLSFILSRDKVLVARSLQRSCFGNSQEPKGMCTETLRLTVAVALLPYSARPTAEDQDFTDRSRRRTFRVLRWSKLQKQKCGTCLQRRRHHTTPARLQYRPYAWKGQDLHRGAYLPTLAIEHN